MPPVGLFAQRIVVDRSMRAPLPDALEVERIAASDVAIWFQGVDHSKQSPVLAAYQWSFAGVRRITLPESPERDPLIVTGLFADAGGRGYLVTNRGLYQAEGDRFLYRDDFRQLSIKSLKGSSDFWLITSEDEIYYLPVLQGQAARKQAEGLGVIEQTSVSPTGDLFVAARGARGTRLLRIGRNGSIVTELAENDIPPVTALYADANDVLWAGLADGRVARRQAGITDWFGADQGLAGPGATQIFEDLNGSFYLLQPIPENEEASILAVPRSKRANMNIDFLRASLANLRGAPRTGVVDHLGGVWLSIGRHGAFRLQGLAELNWPRGTALDQLEAVAPPLTVKAAGDGARRSADATTGITALPGAKLTILNNARGMLNNSVSCIVSDNSGAVYFTTGFENQGDDPTVAGTGITRFDHRQVTNFTTANGLASNTVQACVFDATRNVVWFGTTNGVSRYNVATSVFTNFIVGQKVQDIIMNGSTVLAGTFTGGVYRLNADTGATLNQYAVGNNKVTSLVVDNTGTLFAGTSGNGLYFLNGASFTQLVTVGGTLLIQDLEVDASNNLWISVWNAGVYRRTPAGVFTLFTSAHGLGGVFASVYRTYRIERDAANNLWFSHSNFGEAGVPKAAVTFLAAGQVNAAAPAFARYTTANGFPVNVVLALHSQDASTMWFGSPGGGAWRLGGPVDAPGWPQALTGNVSFNSPLLVDLDGNRNLEVVVGDHTGKIYAFRPNGTLLWSYDTRNAFPGQNTVQSSVAAGDVDGDGEIELVVGLGGQQINGAVGQGGVLILSRLGAFERFLNTYDITGPGLSGQADGLREGVFATPVLANVDSDPELEIMAGAFDNMFYAWNGDGTPIYSKDNDGDGRFDEDFLGDFTPYTPFNLGDDFPGIRFVDDDGDGSTDEGAASDDDEDGRIDEDYPEWPFNARDSIVSSAAVFDLYANGQKSIVFGHDYSGDTTFRRGGVLQAFNPRGESLPGFPMGNIEQVIWSSPVIVDLDNDGVSEIIHGSGLDLSTVGDAPADALVGQLVYAWKRDGASFKAGTNGRLASTAGRSQASFAVGDLDNDGSPELVIATTSLRNKLNQYINQSGTVVDPSLALGQQVYAFTTNGDLKPGFPVRPYTVTPGANVVGSPILADVNGDGFLDIVIAAGPGLIALDRNGRVIPGMGLFENLQDLTFGGEIQGTPAIGDIDLDGNLELVWTQGTGNGATAVVRVVKLGAVNSTVQRSWPMWRRGANRNGVFGPLIGLAQVYESANMATFNIQGYAGRNPVSTTVNLTPLGISATFTLVEAGGWFSGSINVAAVPAGRYFLPVTVTDSAGRTDAQTLVYVRDAATARLHLSPSTLSFGTVSQGDATQLQVNIANIGNAAVTVNSITTNSGEFTIAVAAAFPQTLAPGGVLMATVRFRPGPTGGARNAILTVNSNDPTGIAKTVTLTGSASGGTAGCTFSLNPSSSGVVAYTGIKSSFTVTPNPASCAWTASSNQSWAQVFPLNGTGTGNIEYTIFPNFSTRTRSASFNVSGATFNVTQHPAPGTADQRFVGQIYFNVLGRLASQADINLQTNALASGTSRADLVWGFFNSEEFNLGGRLLAGLYVGLLDRNPEYGGWLFQRNALATGTPRDGFVSAFLGSQEYMLKFGNPSNDNYVRQLYRNVLLREPSPSEVQFHSGHLATDTTRVQLATNFLNSNEFRNGTGPRLTTFLLYALLLQRDPTPSERSLREAQISGGAVVRDLIAEILNASEFNILLQ